MDIELEDQYFITLTPLGSMALAVGVLCVLLLVRSTYRWFRRRA